MVEPAAPSIQQCRLCKSALVQGAEKCPHCGAYQHWLRRGLTAVPTALGLIPLWGVGIAIYLALTGHSSEIVGAVAESTPAGINLSVSNQGDRAATLMGGEIHFLSFMENCDDATLMSQLRGSSLPQVVLPGQTIALSATAQNGFTLPNTFTPKVQSGELRVSGLEKHNTCKVVLNHVDHNQSYKQASIPFNCDSAYQLGGRDQCFRDEHKINRLIIQFQSSRN